MPPQAPSTPSYRPHKATGQAVVTLNGSAFYLGRFGSPWSRETYDRLIGEWLSNGRYLTPRRHRGLRPRTEDDVWPRLVAPRAVARCSSQPRWAGFGGEPRWFCGWETDGRGGRLRRYRRVHVICDNAILHDCRVVGECLAPHGDQIVNHILPKYAPDLNPIERIWWHLHEKATRNHRCQTMDELLDLVFEWLEHPRPFDVDRDAYLRSKAA